MDYAKLKNAAAKSVVTSLLANLPILTDHCDERDDALREVAYHSYLAAFGKHPSPKMIDLILSYLAVLVLSKGRLFDDVVGMLSDAIDDMPRIARHFPLVSTGGEG